MLSPPIVHATNHFQYHMFFLRHNEIRDLTAHLLMEVCHCVSTEPTLQPITGEVFNHATAITEDSARLDIAANGFWGGEGWSVHFLM